MTGQTSTDLPEAAACDRHLWRTHNARTAIGFRLGARRTGTPLRMNGAERLSRLQGVCEEYQSSAIGVAHLRAALRCEPSLAAVLRPSLTEMWEAHRSLRREMRSMLDDLQA